MGLFDGLSFDLAENLCFETTLSDHTQRAEWPAYITSEQHGAGKLLRIQANSGAVAFRLDGPKGSTSGPATLRIRAQVTNLGADQINLFGLRGELSSTHTITTDGEHEIRLEVPEGSTPPSLWCQILRQHLADEVTPRTPVPNPRLRLDLMSVEVWPRRELRILGTDRSIIAPNTEVLLEVEGLDPSLAPVVITEVLPSGEVVQETLTEVLFPLQILRTFNGLGRYKLEVRQADLQVERELCIVPPSPLSSTRVAFFDPPKSFGDLHRFPSTPPEGSSVSRPDPRAQRVVIERDRTQIVDRSNLVANLDVEPSLSCEPLELNADAFTQAAQHLFANPRHIVLAPANATTGPNAARWHTLTWLSQSTIQPAGVLPGYGSRQLFRRDGKLYAWLDQPSFPVVLPVTNESQRSNAEGHIEARGLAAGTIPSGARNTVVGPLREPEVLVLRQLNFVEPVQLTRNQELGAFLRIPNPRDALWRGTIQTKREGPLRLRLTTNELELLPGQEIKLPVSVEWPGPFVEHGRHPINLEIKEADGSSITATLEVEVTFPGLQVELSADNRLTMITTKTMDTELTWWNESTKIKREQRQRLAQGQRIERVIPELATHVDVISGIRTIRYTLQGMREGGV